MGVLFMRRWARGGDGPKGQDAIDEAARDLRTAGGIALADFNRRGTTMPEAQRAYQGKPFPDRLPPRSRLRRGVSVKDALLDDLRAGRLLGVAVNYGAVQDAKKGIGSFRGGHFVVATGLEGDLVVIADSLRTELTRWPIWLLVKAMETFGSNPWGNGRGEAVVAYPSPTYREAYAETRRDLKTARATVERQLDAIASCATKFGLAVEERDTALRQSESIRRDLVAFRAEADERLTNVTRANETLAARLTELEQGCAPLEEAARKKAFAEVALWATENAA